MRSIATRAGMHRLASSCTVVALALATQTTVTVAQTTRVLARGKSDTVVKDSVRIATTRVPLMIVLRRIDSLAKLQDSMTIGSPEYVRVDAALGTMIRTLMPNGSDGRVTITLGPEGVEQMSRSPIAAQRMTVKDVEPRGWLGMFADGLHQDWTEPDGHYYQYFVYPIVVTVDANSPAAKVGVQFGDSLIAFNGQDLRRNVVNLTRLIEPGRTLKVTLRRDGETKDVAIIPDKIPPNVVRERRTTAVAELLPSRAPVAAMAGDSADRRVVERMASAGRGGRGFSMASPVRAPMMTPINVLFGARLTELDSAGTAAVTRDKAWHGVFVAEVPPGSPAARMGLRSADMIIQVGDVDVFSVLQLRRELILRESNRATQLVVVRQGKIEKLTYER